MTTIESVRKFVETYPALAGSKLNVDFLPPKAAAFSVDVVPVKSVVKSYLDGSTLRQFLFVLASRAYWGPDIRQQVDNLCFFEDFEEWLDAQNRARNFPDLGEGRTARKLEVVTSGYAFAPDADMARYQIQCKLTYFQKGGNQHDA